MLLHREGKKIKLVAIRDLNITLYMNLMHNLKTWSKHCINKTEHSEPVSG